MQLITVNHPLDPTKRRSGIEQGPKMTIEDDVWIDAGVPILPRCYSTSRGYRC